MNPLEKRIIGYALAGAIVIGGSGWAGHKLTAMHYDKVIAEEEAKRQLEVNAAQQRIIDAQTAQKNAEDTARADHEKLVEANAKLSGSISNSVHDLEISIGSALSTAMANSKGVSGTGTGPGSDPELTEVLSRLGTALEKTTTTCLHDSAELTGILKQYAELNANQKR